MIKVTLNEESKQEENFPKLVTLSKCGGIFLAISKQTILCLDKGQSGWENGEVDNKLDFKFINDNRGEYFTDYTKPVTIKNI